MSDLVSKVSAGGLSAGVFLLWWPAHVTAQGGEWLFVRGILWSLVFEILLVAFKPLEQAVAAAVRRREAPALGRRGVARVLTVAALGVAVPLGMFAGAAEPDATPARAAAPRVVVKREVVRREVVVRRVSHVVRVPVAAATPTPAATAAAPRRATTTSAPAKRPATTHKAPASKVVATAPRHSATKTSPADTPPTTKTPAATTPATAQTTPAAPATPATAASGTTASATAPSAAPAPGS
jgi:outer membrane biosynthesis protein TonB